ncbi:hypothetical protein M5689_015416 [Euphorbia peplus]|nr:hypothetical protein M5689_015416 [Euphorbia peplus]
MADDIPNLALTIQNANFVSREFRISYESLARREAINEARALAAQHRIPADIGVYAFQANEHLAFIMVAKEGIDHNIQQMEQEQRQLRRVVALRARGMRAEVDQLLALSNESLRVLPANRRMNQ